ncbi:F15K9.18 [Arabidopsis thaliana]|uniref:F15K9.18 n=1 Tax=Arabidopsis thaliana TaxID=3702 RepID=Q9ZVS3_ARATH|nr:F15K9.18 [Arabidopsis thaliana]
MANATHKASCELHIRKVFEDVDPFKHTQNASKEVENYELDHIDFISSYEDSVVSHIHERCNIRGYHKDVYHNVVDCGFALLAFTRQVNHID